MIIFRPFHGGYVGIFQLTVVLVGTCMLLAVFRHSDRQILSRPPSIYDYTDGKTRGTWQNETAASRPPPPSDESVYLRYLAREYGLSNEISYLSRRVRPKFDARTRKSVTEISRVPFVTPRDDFRRVRADDERLDLHAESSSSSSPALALSVTQSPRPDGIDASALLFGISTSYDRLAHGNWSLVADWARWLTDGAGNSNGADLVLTLHRAFGAEVAEIADRLREAGIEAVILRAPDGARDSAARYRDLIGRLTRRSDELLGAGRPPKQFLALVDDDVFFPSLGRLLARLDGLDARRRQYVGLPSERADWTVEANATLTTYGGGAVLLTPAMADTASRLPCLNETAPRAEATATGQWDEQLYRCITAHTDARLHVLPSLYAPGDSDSDSDSDSARGPRSARYEAGAQPLALHHYRHRRPRLAAGRAHLAASLCGEDCFLQRFFFRADAWILVNGCSLSRYPDGVDVLPPAARKGGGTESGQVKVAERLTFDRQDEVPRRRADAPSVVLWAGAKRTWRLLDSRCGEGGEVWQAYVKRRGSSSPYADEEDWDPDDTVHTQDGPEDVDSVVVLIWEP
ncbi:glycosyltransferase family 31 protein [Hypoxylon sp. FL1284]|nr:glycosyltransferase family 31 protein [Hypoxylon sp. FL1284]